MDGTIRLLKKKKKGTQQFHSAPLSQAPPFSIFRPEFAAGRHARFCFEVGLDCVRACACVCRSRNSKRRRPFDATYSICMHAYIHTYRVARESGLGSMSCPCLCLA